MALSWPNKDPDEILDYTIDWSARLVSETIATSAWTLDATDDPLLATTSNTFTNTTTTIWLTGGTEGAKSTITNRITTSGGRTMDQSVTIKIKSK